MILECTIDIVETLVFWVKKREYLKREKVVLGDIYIMSEGGDWLEF